MYVDAEVRQHGKKSPCHPAAYYNRVLTSCEQLFDVCRQLPSWKTKRSEWLFECFPSQRSLKRSLHPEIERKPLPAGMKKVLKTQLAACVYTRRRPRLTSPSRMLLGGQFSM
ncbi:unnamed protein product [Symbiodinium sp. CCMP2456]|nr:unnamed protein product [Symbiodinium sp. CCMP2456]